MSLELSYVCILSLLQLLIWISYLDILPKANFVTYTINDVLYCMCLLAFFVTSADKSHLCVIFMLFTNILPEAICCCLETFNVNVVLFTLFCIIVHKLSWSLVLTSVSYRYI